MDTPAVRELVLSQVIPYVAQITSVSYVVSGVIGGMMSLMLSLFMGYRFTVAMVLLPGGLLAMSGIFVGTTRYVLISMSIGASLWLSPLMMIFSAIFGFVFYLHRNEMYAGVTQSIRKTLSYSAYQAGDMIVIPYMYQGELYKATIPHRDRPRGPCRISARLTQESEWQSVHDTQELCRFLGPDGSFAGGMPPRGTFPYSAIQVKIGSQHSQDYNL